MGVSGVGKSTVAAALAARLRVELCEGDDLHPAANVDKMAHGVPLVDADRWPWLDRIHDWLAARARSGDGGVVTCSALRRAYRDRLRADLPDVRFVHLTVPLEQAGERVAHRRGHFMPASLVASQYAVLEPLAPDEPGVVVPAEGRSEEVVQRALDALGLGDR